MTDEAQADLEAGRAGRSQSQGGKAQDIDVAYDLLDKTPEDVLDKASQMQDKRYLAKRAAAASGGAAGGGGGCGAGRPAGMGTEEIARTEGA